MTDRQTKALRTLVEACRRLRAARDERWERAREAQRQAAEARRTGVGRSLALAPTVHDIGDVTEEIIEALTAWERLCGAASAGEETDDGVGARGARTKGARR
jgi:hypothetical protein